MSLKIVSVNIEGDNHLERVKAFLEKEGADVICLLEVFEERVGELAGSKYPHRVFAPNVSVDGRPMGAVIVSKLSFMETEGFYCDGREQEYLPDFQADVGTHRPVVVMASLQAEGKIWQIGATHFTWTRDGLPTEQQKADVVRLLKRLGDEGFVLAGDFNIPRPNGMYQKLAAVYRDNIPQEVTSTIDPDLHRINKAEKGKLAIVVDYLWTTSGYRAEKVRIECGVSDHCAVVGEISKV